MAKKPKKITRKRVQAVEGKPFIPEINAKPEIDNDPTDDDGLTVRSRQFVAAITGAAAGNATKAADMAGYASNNRRSLEATASRLLRNVKVHQAICRALAKKNATPEWAKDRLIELASSTMANFLSIDDDGKPITDFRKAASAAAIGHIKEFQADVLPGSEGEQEIIRCKIKVHDPTAALGMLLKLHGLLKDKDEEPESRQIRVRRVSRKKADADA